MYQEVLMKQLLVAALVVILGSVAFAQQAGGSHPTRPTPPAGAHPPRDGAPPAGAHDGGAHRGAPPNGAHDGSGPGGAHTGGHFNPGGHTRSNG